MSYLSVGASVPRCVDGHVGHEEREAARQSLGAREVTVGRARERREPQVIVREVLCTLRLQHLQTLKLKFYKKLTREKFQSMN